MARPRKKETPLWVPEGYTLDYNPREYEPHVHVSTPAPGTPAGARLVCAKCGGTLVAKNTQQGFRWVLGARLSEGGIVR
jgi:hypothetical protein